MFKNSMVLKLSDKHSMLCNLLGQVQLSICGVNVDMSAIVGFVEGGEGFKSLLWILLLVPNSFLKQTAFPYVKPNLV